MNLIAYVAAVVLFLIAALAAPLGSLTALELVALGLAAFALAHILPPRP